MYAADRKAEELRKRMEIFAGGKELTCCTCGKRWKPANPVRFEVCSSCGEPFCEAGSDLGRTISDLLLFPLTILSAISESLGAPPRLYPEGYCGYQVAEGGLVYNGGGSFYTDGNEYVSKDGSWNYEGPYTKFCKNHKEQARALARRLGK